MKKSTVKSERSIENLYIPDFCGVRMIFAVVIVAELLAFVIVLSAPTSWKDAWDRLSLISLFIQWVALSSAGILCRARPYLARLRTTWASAAAYGLILAMTVFFTEVAYAIGRHIMQDPSMTTQWHVEFFVKNFLISTIVGAVTLRYFYMQHLWKKNVEAEARARLQALQSRIQPHFLFNSMNTIASLTRRNPALAEEVTEDLAELFRVSLSNAAALSTFGQEVELARRYLNIEGLRLGERLRVDWRIEGIPPHAPLPSLTLQPLLENAIYHGIEPLPEGGEIVIEGTMEKGKLHLRITNPAPPPSATPARRERHGLALDNTRQRLGAHFGTAASLTTELRDGCFYATLVTPLRQED